MKKKSAADQIWLPLNIAFKLSKRTKSIYGHFRLRKKWKKTTSLFSIFLAFSWHWLGNKILTSFRELNFSGHTGFAITYCDRKHLLSLSSSEKGPTPLSSVTTYLFCGSLSRNSGWTGMNHCPKWGQPNPLFWELELVLRDTIQLSEQITWTEDMHTGDLWGRSLGCYIHTLNQVSWIK